MCIRDRFNESGYQTTDDNCYERLKDYEAHRINIDGLKYSPLRYISPAIRKGLDTKDLSDDECRYLRTLLRLTKLPKPPEARPYTLTDWFNLPWLRSVLGERHYLSTESPARLLVSFRVTIAATLSYLLEIREKWKQQPDLSWESNDGKMWFLDWNFQLIKHLGTFDAAGEPLDDITEVLCLDLVGYEQWSTIKTLIAEHGIERLRKVPYAGKQPNPWRCPVIFHPDNLSGYSKLDEQLMAWLMACEAIQPSDIPKFKTTHYAQEFNSSGRLIAMQCTYYKGRAGAIREPAMLVASDCWTKAQHTYLAGLPAAAPLFQSDVGRAAVLPDLRSDAKFAHSSLNKLLRLWHTPRLQARIRAALKRAEALPIFLDSMFGLQVGSQPYSLFKSRNSGVSNYNYETAVPRPLPRYVFSLTHIKTTAVHAGSDQYRDGDLINHHSHTSATEKHYYLTDANKDFVNRSGRITRLVLHDLQNVVYQPSISSIKRAVNDLELRSRVIEATGSEDAHVHPLHFPATRSDSDDLILVPDTVEQALVFIHSITQAEERYQHLLNQRPDWVERTLLPQLEWMSRTLLKMGSATKAQKEYAQIKLYLPPVFDHLLETLE
ncbi:MAG TPA: hypothetical protein ENI27_04535 [bacterium]|nr:hypothetical protein [bacterium]